MSEERTCATCCYSGDEDEKVYCDAIEEVLPGVMHDCEEWEAIRKAEPSDPGEMFEKIQAKLDKHIRGTNIQIADIIDRLEEAGVDGLEDSISAANDRIDFLLTQRVRLDDIKNINKRIDTIMDRLDAMCDINRRFSAIDEVVYNFKTKSSPWPCEKGGIPSGIGSD